MCLLQAGFILICSGLCQPGSPAANPQFFYIRSGPKFYREICLMDYSPQPLLGLAFLVSDAAHFDFFLVLRRSTCTCLQKWQQLNGIRWRMWQPVALMWVVQVLPDAGWTDWTFRFLHLVWLASDHFHRHVMMHSWGLGQQWFCNMGSGWWAPRAAEIAAWCVTSILSDWEAHCHCNHSLELERLFQWETHLFEILLPRLEFIDAPGFLQFLLKVQVLWKSSMSSWGFQPLGTRAFAVASKQRLFGVYYSDLASVFELVYASGLTFCVAWAWHPCLSSCSGSLVQFACAVAFRCLPMPEPNKSRPMQWKCTKTWIY